MLSLLIDKNRFWLKGKIVILPF